MGFLWAQPDLWTSKIKSLTQSVYKWETVNKFKHTNDRTSNSDFYKLNAFL